MSETIEELDAKIDALDRAMDATQTLLHLEAGQTITQEQIDDLLFLDEHHRSEAEIALDCFSRGYECGLERGAGADTAKLIEERDSARTKVQVTNAVSSAAERWAFIKGAQVCREMMARFVEGPGSETERNIACSIRANWHPKWGDDPGPPDEEAYASAMPREISARAA